MVDTDRRRLAAQGQEMTMSQYRISSKAAADYGVWPGETPETAFAAMVAEAGGEVGDESVGTADDWDVVEMTHVVEGRGDRGDWSREYVEAGGDALFSSEAEALAAIESLITVCGWSRDDLRVREA